MSQLVYKGVSGTTRNVSQRTHKRPLMAALLSFIQPGIGHLYLREWFRASMWVGLWAGSLALILVTTGVDLSTVDLLAAAFGIFAAMESFPIEAALSMLAVTVFATLDAYWIATRNNHQLRGALDRCPHCGKELDPTLEFCHWCTATLDGESQES